MPAFVGRTPLSAYRYSGSLAYVAVAAVAVPVSLRGPGQHAVVLPDRFQQLMGAPAQERDKNPAWAGNDKRE